MNADFLAALGLDPHCAASILEEYENDLSLIRQKCEAAEAALSHMQYDAAVQNAIKNVRVSSAAAQRDFIAQLKNLNLEVIDGSLAGFDQFLEEQKALDPDAFASDRPVPQFVAPVGSGGSPHALPLNVRQAREIGAKRAAAIRSSSDVLKNFL